MITAEALSTICLNVSRKLVNLLNEMDGAKDGLDASSKLIFPQYERTKKEVRISEQESRVLFCHEVEKYSEKLFYSVETPTSEKYCFKGNCTVDSNGQSAMSDLSLFELNQNNKFEQIVNVEFKAHNVEETHIKKDLLKLIAEPCSGLFFHTLKNTDSGTLNNSKKTGILDKYQLIQTLEKDDWKGESNKYILFYICIINEAKILSQVFTHKAFTNNDGYFFNKDSWKKKMPFDLTTKN